MNRYPEAGLTSLLASRGRGGDTMLVHMNPEEVRGLQALAVANGTSLSRNPHTGAVEALKLKDILPMVAGAVLGPAGFGMSAFKAAATVGLGYGLVEGDLKKGLMAGLGAYSGANLTGALKDAAGVGAPVGAEPAAPTSQVSTSAPPSFAPPSVKDQIMYGGAAPRGFDIDPVRAANWAASNTPAVGAAAARAQTTVKGPFATMGQGLRNVFTSGEARNKFMEGLGGNISKYATFAGAAIPFAEKPTQFPTGSAGGDELVYIPGEYDPTKGTVFQSQGRYYRRTPQGLMPVNPWQLAPGARGFATGGSVQPMDQERVIPHQNPTIPAQNQSYPLAEVMGVNYGAAPRSREIMGGYETKINPFTGEERFAEGGNVGNQSAYDQALANYNQKQFSDAMSILTMNPGMSFDQAQQFVASRNMSGPAPNPQTFGVAGASAGLGDVSDKSANFSWGSNLAYDPTIYQSSFDWQNYIAKNPDLQAAGIDTPWEAATHYATYGKNENRAGISFGGYGSIAERNAAIAEGERNFLIENYGEDTPAARRLAMRQEAGATSAPPSYDSCSNFCTSEYDYSSADCGCCAIKFYKYSNRTCWTSIQ